MKKDMEKQMKIDPDCRCTDAKNALFLLKKIAPAKELTNIGIYCVHCGSIIKVNKGDCVMNYYPKRCPKMYNCSEDVCFYSHVPKPKYHRTSLDKDKKILCVGSHCVTCWMLGRKYSLNGEIIFSKGDEQ